MTDDHEPLDEVSAAEYDQLAALLSRDEVWDEPDPYLEDRVVAAILAEAESTGGAADGAVSLATRRARRANQFPTRWLGAAAVVALVIAGVALFGRGSGSSGVAFALEGTDAAPGASAEAVIAATPAGLKILLDTEGLAGAPDGYMYEAWVSNGDIGVSAGTFHLRGGDNQIELWAGVTDAAYTRLAVTLEPIDGDATSSGDARLVGTFSIDD